MSLPVPFISCQQTKEYTLVIDLDETLVHFQAEKGKFLIRNYCQEFILQMFEYFELVIFTAAQ